VNTITNPTKTIAISSDLAELRVAVQEEGRTVEAYVERRGRGSLAGNIYKAKVDNVLRGMSRRSGAQIWKRALPMRPTSGPVLAGTTLLVSGLETSIRSYATKDGAPGADVKADGVIAAPPAIVHVPSIPEPVLLYVANDLAKGATVIAATHSPDPAVSSNAFSPLPNPIKP